MDDSRPITDADITTAQRLARKWLYEGYEPYAPAVYSIASMLAEHKREVLAALGGDRQAEAHAEVVRSLLSELALAQAERDDARKEVKQYRSAAVGAAAKTAIAEGELREARERYREDIAELARRHNEMVSAYENQLAPLEAAHEAIVKELRAEIVALQSFRKPDF